MGSLCGNETFGVNYPLSFCTEQTLFCFIKLCFCLAIVCSNIHIYVLVHISPEPEHTKTSLVFKDRWYFMQDSLLFHHFEQMSYETCFHILSSASPKESIMITNNDNNGYKFGSFIFEEQTGFILQPLLAGSEQTVAGRAAGVLLSADSRAHFRPSSGRVDRRFDLLPLAGAPKDGADRDEELAVLGQAGDFVYYSHTLNTWPRGQEG